MSMITLEEECLGDLMKEINFDDSISLSLGQKPHKFIKDEEEEKSISTLIPSHLFPPQELFSPPSTKDNTPIQNKNPSPLPLPLQKSENEISQNFFFTKELIINAFASQKSTILLQKSLREVSNEVISHIIKLISGNFCQMMQDRNGNYFCSDLFKVCTVFERIKIIQEIKNNLYSISLNEFGTHPIQTLIELSTTQDEYNLLISCFNNDLNKILQASLNPNGSYVVQKIISHTPEQFRINFNFLILKIIKILFYNMYGVCIVKKFLSCTQNEIILNQSFGLISLNLVTISQNQFGNYLIQYILKTFWGCPRIDMVKNLILENFGKLASEKFSSHICELFIDLSNMNEKKFIMNMIINNGYFGFLSKNKFGVYVINKLIKSISLGINLNNINNNNYNY